LLRQLWQLQLRQLQQLRLDERPPPSKLLLVLLVLLLILLVLLVLHLVLQLRVRLWQRSWTRLARKGAWLVPSPQQL